MSTERWFAPTLLAPAGTLCALALLCSCGPKGPPGPKVEQRAVSIGVQDSTISGLVLIADRTGAFRDEGLDLTVRRYPSGKLALQGMFAGEVDVAAVSGIPAAIAAFGRDDFCLFASVARSSNPAWILARSDVGVLAPGDLRGRRIGTQRGSAVHYFLSAFLLENGIAEEEVEIVFLPATELAGALVAGRVDAIAMRNPVIAEAKAALPGATVEFFAPEVYRQFFGLAAFKGFLERAPGTAAALLRALGRAEAIARRDPDRGRRSVDEGLGGARAAEVAADWGEIEFSLSLSQQFLMNLEDQAAWAARGALAAGPPPANFLRWICLGPMRATRPERLTVYH